MLATVFILWCSATQKRSNPSSSACVASFKALLNALEVESAVVAIARSSTDKGKGDIDSE